MRTLPKLLSVTLTYLLTSAASAQDLKCGMPAPDFAPEGFVQGPAIDQLQLGQKYVIEFSGTHCVPCIQFIPRMEKLKEEHPEFTFVSVLSAPKADVQRFLEDSGRAITSAVAYDSTSNLYRS